MKEALQSAVRTWEATSRSSPSCLIAFAADLRDEHASVHQDGIYGNSQVVGVQIFSGLGFIRASMLRGTLYFQKKTVSFGDLEDTMSKFKALGRMKACEWIKSVTTVRHSPDLRFQCCP